MPYPKVIVSVGLGGTKCNDGLNFIVQGNTRRLWFVRLVMKMEEVRKTLEIVLKTLVAHRIFQIILVFCI